MLVQLHLPERFTMQRDAHGRITQLLGPDRRYLVVSYDDPEGLAPVSAARGLTAWAFTGVRCGRWQRSRPAVSEPTTGPAGWTFVGVPRGGPETSAPSRSYPGLADRFDWARQHLADLERLEEGLAALRGRGTARPIAAADLDRIMALGHLARAMEEAGQTAAHRLATLAWQHAVASATRGYREEASVTADGHVVFDPSADPTSGNSEEQSEGNSPQGTDDDEDCAEQQEQCLDGADDIADIDVEDCYRGIDQGTGECEMWDLYHCWTALDLIDLVTGEPVWPVGVDPVACINEYCAYYEPGDSPLGSTGADGLSPDQQNDLVDCIDKALEEIKQNRGNFYDPEVVDTCVRLFEQKKFRFD